uniref:C2H2-type domain-containing protein n=1 Tax=Timema cristinae TaxID=61476 RepID=A0A7R9HFJ2_TIMCR|nr:unnamed protein product [Timema cristinae]
MSEDVVGRCDEEVLDLIHSIQRHEEENGFTTPGLVSSSEVDLELNRTTCSSGEIYIREDSLQAIRSKVTQLLPRHENQERVAHNFRFSLDCSERDERHSVLRQSPPRDVSAALCDTRTPSTPECGPGDKKTLLKVREHGQHTCSMCEGVFRSISEIMDHFISCHSTDKATTGDQPSGKRLQCSVCGESFSKLGALRKHLQSHRIDKAFECPVCKVNFKTKFLLKIHLKLHQGQNILECSVCKKPFTDRTDLDLHFKVHSEGKNLYPCSFCDVSFPSKSLLGSHRKVHKVDRQTEEVYECHVCSKVCSGRRKLSRHFNIHTGVKPHVCSECPKSFATKKQLTCHFRTHSGEKPYTCQVCSRSFAFQNSWKTHLKTHDGRDTFSCAHCGSNFTQKSNLRRHTKLHRETRVCHVCESCGRVFLSKKEYNVHLKSHRVVPQEYLLCYLCDKKFTQRTNLTRHLKLHVLLCDICCETFPSRDQLLRHFKIHEQRRGGSPVETSCYVTSRYTSRGEAALQ